jgi:hypothetical protein
MPVGVISSSARMIPMNPAAQPSRRPAKMMGLALADHLHDQPSARGKEGSSIRSSDLARGTAFSELR